MNEKSKFYIGKIDYDLILTNPTLKTRQSILITNFRECESDIEVEIKEIVPVYEYRFIFRNKNTDDFHLSEFYCKDLDDCRNSISETYEPIRLIEETKRVRK